MHGVENLQGGPASTLTSRHMLEIQYDETMGVSFLAGQSNTISPRAAGNVGAVNTDICCSAPLADQTLTLRRASIDIVDVSVRRVATLWLVRQC